MTRGIGGTKLHSWFTVEIGSRVKYSSYYDTLKNLQPQCKNKLNKPYMSKRETKNVGGNNENNQQRLNASTNTQ